MHQRTTVPQPIRATAPQTEPRPATSATPPARGTHSLAKIDVGSDLAPVQRTKIGGVDKTPTQLAATFFKFKEMSAAKAALDVEPWKSMVYADVPAFLAAASADETLAALLDPKYVDEAIKKAALDARNAKLDAMAAKAKAPVVKRPTIGVGALDHVYLRHTRGGIAAAGRILSDTPGPVAVFGAGFGKPQLEALADALSGIEIAWISRGASQYDGKTTVGGTRIQLIATAIGNTMSVDTFFPPELAMARADVEALYAPAPTPPPTS